MALRQIRTFDDEILRKKSRMVEVVDDRIRQILNDMADTMYNAENCGGLAAPQIGILKRLVVIDMGNGLIKLVNPKIIEKQGTQEVVEGCLSIPNKWGKLIRPEKVIVQALNENGEEITLTGTGDLAKCFCHEIDHLEGILFTDLVIEYLKL
jgi:peptide deformylase